MLGKNSSFIGSVPEFYERYLVPMHFEADARTMVDRLGDRDQQISWRSQPPPVQCAAFGAKRRLA